MNHAAKQDVLKIRRNYPYLGKADGFTTYLRRRFLPCDYAGIELEVNQRRLDPPSSRRRLANQLARSLRVAIASFNSGK